MKKRVALIGGGDLGRQAIQIHATNPVHEIVAIYDDILPIGTIIEKTPVTGKLSEIISDHKNNQFDALCICIGYKHLPFKTQLLKQFESIPMANIVHSSAVIEKSAELKGSNIIFANAYIGEQCVLNPGAIINVGTSLAHDISVGISSFISVGIQVAGNVSVGNEVFMGIGAVCINDLSIADHTFIGAGTVVIKSLEAGKYVGNPAKKIET